KRLVVDERLRASRERVGRDYQREAPGARWTRGATGAVVAGEVAAGERQRPGAVDQLVEPATGLADERPAEAADRGSREWASEPRAGIGAPVPAIHPSESGAVAEGLAQQRRERVRVNVLDDCRGTMLEPPSRLLDAPAQLDVGARFDALVEAAEALEGFPPHQEVGGDPGR